MISNEKETLLHNSKQQYLKALPFPHIVLDNFFDTGTVERILAEFPDKKDISWIDYYDSNQIKLAIEDRKNIGIFTNSFLSFLNSAKFLKLLEDLVEIPNLIPDPSFRGGGLHNIFRGGKLNIHIDFNRHQKNLHWDRRLNLILYLNKDWKEEFKGHLELWDLKMKTCVKKILPIFNRMVIFETTKNSFHGHPNPLKCSANRSRKSLALYYYTLSSDNIEDIKTHSTLFQNRPGEKTEHPLKTKIKKRFRRLFSR